jgi:hypothetical protein
MTDAVIAIDVLIEPNTTMTSFAEAANAQLLAVHPDGFALDAAHRPHITTVQRYVMFDQLDEVYAALAEVLAVRALTEWELTATGYYYLPWGNLGLAGIVVEPTAQLLELQAALLSAVDPFASDHGSAAAFVTTIEDPAINQPTIDYVSGFTERSTGVRFNPHVTIGAPQVHLDAMIAMPFPAFTFTPASVAVYQLGNLGTAARHLTSL